MNKEIPVAEFCTFHRAPDPEYITLVLHRHLHGMQIGLPGIHCPEPDCALAVASLRKKDIRQYLEGEGG